MRRLSIFILLLLSSSALSINPGETGGGNVCKLKFMNRWVLVDQLANRNEWTNQRRYTPFSDILPIRTGKPMEKVNLYKTRIIHTIERKLTVERQESLALTWDVLHKLTFLYSSAFILNNANLPAKRVDQVAYAFCEPQSVFAAVLTFDNGVVIFSRPKFEQLSPTDQEMLVVHELFRFLQVILSPSSLDDSTISTWTQSVKNFNFKRVRVLSSFKQVESELQSFQYAIDLGDMMNARKDLKELTLQTPITKVSEVLRRNLIIELLLGSELSFKKLLLSRENKAQWERLGAYTAKKYSINVMRDKP